MLTPSSEILPWLLAFAPAMSAPTFANLLTLVCGSLLTPGPRTVTAALRVLGREQGNFSKYHRFFHRAHWSPMLLSRLLLELLVHHFVPPGEPLLVIADEHLERRRARKIAYRSLFRDPIRSSAQQVQFTWGVRWLCLALLVAVPWSRRRWAWPFLVFPLLSEKVCQRLGKRHRTVVEVTGDLVAHVRRWQPERKLVLIGDGTYAAVPLANRCRELPGSVVLVSRLRFDAVLHDFPGPRRPGQRGATPKKGPRVPNLAERLAAETTEWRAVELAWYGEAAKPLELATGVCLWYRGGHAPTPIRWVLLRSPAEAEDPIEPGACFTTDVDATPEQILAWFTGRWNIEVTFAELRAHLGFETQRHWSRRAVDRVTPCLFGLFSVVVVLAKELHPQELPVWRCAWYPKAEPTFADALAVVRRYLWSRLLPTPGSGGSGNCVTSTLPTEVSVIPTVVWERIQQVACYAT